jgi:uncharacterized damage-inducible protein DinB
MRILMLVVLPLVILLVLFLGGVVEAQTQPQQQAPPTLEQVMLRQWNAVHNKVIVMAKDFPEDKLNYRPCKECRSFMEEVWHVTATSQWHVARLKGQQVDADKLFSNEGRPTARAEFVAQLESTVKECAALLEKNPDLRTISIIGHAGEHYGKMVTIYRLNGLVPPASRNPQGN